MSYETEKAVIDIGSLFTKVGAAGADQPDSVMFSCVDIDNEQRGQITSPGGVRWPVVNSRVADWEAMGSLIELIFDDWARTQTFYQGICLLQPFGLDRQS